MVASGNSARAATQEKLFSFKTTDCYLSYRRSFMRYNNLTDIVFCFNLKIRSLFQSLWNRLEKDS